MKKERDDGKLVAELSEKVDALHKGIADTLRKGLEITYPDNEPQSDDLLPVDTALMERCIAEALALRTGLAPVIAQSLFIGALLDSLVGAVRDLEETVEDGMVEMHNRLVSKEAL